ncbi:putative fatty acyl-CoA reductase CG5065 isoform X3 [Choristoneura fumiferana]|uniref:putative fatty acyl-CoA reductase CG5065 isoform X3 n=1 Tax=Choristoneura fumiferana TaxID=7141 RepID=UPI003D15880B
MEFTASNLEQRLFSSNNVFAETPITEFYAGKSVFITGSTGFLGTLLLGKLLTTCPIKRVYVLIKPKKGKNVSERLTELLKSMIQVVFHSAANIDMSAKLTDTINVNTKGTAELVRLCKGMQQLQAFVYVSTAYSNCNRNLVDERVYEPVTSIDAVYEIYEKLDKVENALYLHNLIEGRPNTYTYSKSLAEKIIDSEIVGIPAVIVRPSVIVSPIKTPLPGWAANWNSVNKVASAISQGVVRCYYGIYDVPFDIVPGDQVVNLLIAAAWDAHRRQLKKVKVYNCCSTYQNPMSSGHFLSSCARVSRKYSEKIICTSMMILTTNRLLFWLMSIFLHTIPAYLLDMLAWLRGNQIRMRKITGSLVRECGVCEYFGFNSITFIDYNVRHLLREMNPEDKILFDFDFSAIDWENFMKIYIVGLKKYIQRK